MDRAKTWTLIIILLAGLGLLSVGHAEAVEQPWRAGWDLFSEQLDYTRSNVTWSHPEGASRLSVTYILRGALPNHQYQVGIHFLNHCLAGNTFGPFPSLLGCGPLTREGFTSPFTANIELGVVTTDAQGNGSFSVVISHIHAGTYDLEFDVRVGVGCLLSSNCDGFFACSVVFQSPGPFGTTTTITFP